MSHVILFVCTGNVCRSPMAQALFNRRARLQGEEDKFVAHSAGTWALENRPASGNAITVMAQRGIDISSHRGHTITLEDFAASVVIVMTSSHREALAAEFPQFRHKLHLMSELRGRTFDIVDPFGGPLPDYESCARELDSLIETGYERIKSWIPATP